MNTPKVQTDVPAEGASPDSNPDGTTPHGIPKEASEGQAKGLPTSDRVDSETTPNRTGTP